MVGDRDRAEPRARARSRAASRPASRSRASGRCACAGRRGSRAAGRSAGAPRGCRAGRGGARRAAGRSPRPGRRPASQSRTAPRRLRDAARAAAPRLGDQALELAREGDRVAGREQQPELAVAGQLAVEGELRARPARSRWRAPCARGRGRGAGPPEAAQSDVGAGDQLLGRAPRAGRRRWTRSRSRLRDPDLGRVGDPDRRLPVAARRQAAERAQEQAQRAALLLEAEGDPQRAARAARPSLRATRARRRASAPGSTSS